MRITREQMVFWGLDAKQLWHWAEINTPKLLPVKLSRMEDVLKESREVLQESRDMPGKFPGVVLDFEEEKMEAEAELYILSNTSGIRGAAAILYPGVLKMAAKQIGGDLIVIPSSIHEMILLKWDESEGPDLEELERMVYDINRQIVLPEEVLSDSVYLYSSSEDQLYQAESGGRRKIWKFNENI